MQILKTLRKNIYIQVILKLEFNLINGVVPPYQKSDWRRAKLAD